MQGETWSELYSDIVRSDILATMFGTKAALSTWTQNLVDYAVLSEKGGYVSFRHDVQVTSGNWS